MRAKEMMRGCMWPSLHSAARIRRNRSRNPFNSSITNHSSYRSLLTKTTVKVIMFRRCYLRTCCSSSSFPSRWIRFFVGQSARVVTTSLSSFVFCLVLVASSLFIATVLLGSDRHHSDVADRPEVKNEADIENGHTSERDDVMFGQLATSREQNLNISIDVIVFLHIQKTGGTTFGRHLVLDLDVDSPCVCSTLSPIFRDVVVSTVYDDESLTNHHHNTTSGFTSQKRKRITSLSVETVTSSNERSTVRRQNRRRSRVGSGQNSERLRCDCRNTEGRTWLFGRESTGWACGLHADWTELNSCVPDTLDRIEGLNRQRRYQYVTLLRDPLLRYLSEWKHVQRGGSAWIAAHLACNGRPATLNEVPLCFNDSNWSGVNLDEFMSCPYNLAANRQTRMLADLTLVGCYNTSSMPTHRRRSAVLCYNTSSMPTHRRRSTVLCYNTSSMPTHRRRSTVLNDAKSNLRRLAFFGITERQLDTEYLFEQRFGVRFRRRNERVAHAADEDNRPVFEQFNSTRAERAAAQLTADELLRIRRVNDLDEQLFDYAKLLFDRRLRAARRFERHRRELQ